MSLLSSHWIIQTLTELIDATREAGLTAASSALVATRLITLEDIRKTSGEAAAELAASVAASKLSPQEAEIITFPARSPTDGK